MPKKYDLLEKVLEVPDITPVVLIGENRLGEPAPLNVDIFADIASEINRLSQVMRSSGTVIDFRTYSVTGSYLAIDYPSTVVSASVAADYTNSGTKQINIAFKMKKTKDDIATSLTQGELRLSPGSSRKIGPHSGFRAYSPESAITFLDVELEGE